MTLHTADEINAMSPAEFKVFENRLRRVARRQGYRIAKSRTRDPRANTYGGYVVINEATNGIESGALWIDIGDVERFFLGDD